MLGKQANAVPFRAADRALREKRMLCEHSTLLRTIGLPARRTASSFLLGRQISVALLLSRSLPRAATQTRAHGTGNRPPRQERLTAPRNGLTAPRTAHRAKNGSPPP